MFCVSASRLWCCIDELAGQYLYEAFVLVAIITVLIYLFHEGRYRTR